MKEHGRPQCRHHTCCAPPVAAGVAQATPAPIQAVPPPLPFAADPGTITGELMKFTVGQAPGQLARELGSKNGRALATQPNMTVGHGPWVL